MKTIGVTLAAILALAVLQFKTMYLDAPIESGHHEITEKIEAAMSEENPFAMQYLPARNTFAKLSTGFEQILSDYYWIKAVTMGSAELMLEKSISPDNKFASEMIEHHEMTDRQRRTSYELLRLTTSYDPNFIYAYEYGSLLLSWSGYVDLAVALLDDGIKNNPDSARLYNSMAFTQNFFLRDFKKGAEYALKAYEAAGPDGEFSNPRMVAQSMAVSGDYDAALKFLRELYKKPQSQMTRDQIETMIKYVKVERDIAFLSEAIERFIRKFGTRPANLEGLVAYGVITEIPQEPFEGKYILRMAPWRVENDPYMRSEHLPAVRSRNTREEAIKERGAPRRAVMKHQESGRGREHDGEDGHGHDADDEHEKHGHE